MEGLGGADALEPHADWSLGDFVWDPHGLVAEPAGEVVGGTPAAAAAAEAAHAAAAAALRAAAAPRRTYSEPPSPLRCQVPACAARLEGLRAYNQRSRLCLDHMRADEVLLEDGTAARFCQKCNRLQPLVDFEGAKHTCAAALASHNARRRRNRRRGEPGSPAADDAAAQAAPPGAALAASGLMNVATWLDEHAPAATTAGAAIMVLLTTNGPASGARAAASSPVGVASSAPARAALAGAAAAAASAAALHGCTVHIKLPAMRSPAALPSDQLRAAALAGGALFAGAMSLPIGSVRPGCVLLTLDALCRRGGGAADAAAVAAALRPAFDGCGAAAARAVVHVGGREAPLAGGGRRASLDAWRAPGAAVPPPQLLGRHVAPCGAKNGEAIELPIAAPPPGTEVHARLAGAALRCEVTNNADTAKSDAAGGGGCMLRLRGVPAAAEGAILLEAQAAPRAKGGNAVAISAPRCVLLCRDAALAAQAGAACDVVAGDAAADARLQRVLRVLGDALRPGAPRRVRCAAAAAAAWLSWDAALRRLLLPCPDADADAGAVLLCATAHAAAAAPHVAPEAAAAVAAALAEASGRQRWSPAGCARAVALLRAASGAGAHARPECAAAAALAAAASSPRDADAAAAAALLRALLPLLEDAADDAAAALDAGDAADVAEARYSAWLGRRNASHTLVIGCLAMLGNVQQLANIIRYVLLTPERAPAAVGDFNQRMLQRTWLHPADAPGGTRFSPQEVPWEVVLQYARFYFIIIAALRLPLHVYWLINAMRLRRAAAAPGPLAFPYERTFFPLIMTDTAIYLLLDLIVLRATGAVVEWPALLCVCHSVGVAIGFRVVPYRLPRLLALVAAKAVASFGPMLLLGHWRICVSNVGYAVAVLACATAAAAAPARDRAAREAAAAEAAAEAGESAKKAQRPADT